MDFSDSSCHAASRMQEAWDDTYVPITDVNKPEIRRFVPMFLPVSRRPGDDSCRGSLD